MKKYSNIDEYIKAYPEHVRELLNTMRQTIRAAAPEASEKISYGIPTFTFHGNLVHFAGYKSHIGFYPGSAPIREFKKDLAGYNTSKGTVQFPLDKPLPLDLITKIVRVCVDRNQSKQSY